MSWRRSGSAKYGRASSSSIDCCAGSYRSRCAACGGEGVQCDLGHLLGGPLPGVQSEPGLQTGGRHGVGHQRRHRVRVGLHRQHAAQHAGAGLAEAVDQRGVDRAGQDLDVGLVERPRGVHLHVRLVDRRDRTDRVDRREERECPPGKVIRRARAPEPDIGLLEAEVLVELGEARHQHLDAVGGAFGAAHMRGMGEADDGNVTISHVVPLTGGACRCRSRRRAHPSAGSSRCCRCRDPTPRGVSTPPRPACPSARRRRRSR